MSHSKESAASLSLNLAFPRQQFSLLSHYFLSFSPLHPNFGCTLPSGALILSLVGHYSQCRLDTFQTGPFATCGLVSCSRSSHYLCLVYLCSRLLRVRALEFSVSLTRPAVVNAKHISSVDIYQCNHFFIFCFLKVGMTTCQ